MFQAANYIDTRTNKMYHVIGTTFDKTDNGDYIVKVIYRDEDRYISISKKEFDQYFIKEIIKHMKEMDIFDVFAKLKNEFLVSIQTKIKDTIELITMMKEMDKIKGTDTVDTLLQKLKEG